VEVEDVGVEHPVRPLLRVVRGQPDDVELAAVTVVLASVAARAGEGSQRSAPRSAWADRAALLRRPLSHGPGAWRSSVLPR
jgi:hypothetical protein